MGIGWVTSDRVARETGMESTSSGTYYGRESGFGRWCVRVSSRDPLSGEGQSWLEESLQWLVCCCSSYSEDVEQ